MEKRLSQYSKGGGCGCKIAPAVLAEIVATEDRSRFDNLLVGNDTNDDAAVMKIDEATGIISTTDFFLPIVDDPFDFGRIAAANAISDVYAMGGKPLMAIAILGWPVEELPVEMAARVLEGGRSICKEAGIPLAGGHSIDTSAPIFGLAVTGIVATGKIKRNQGAQPGDLLYLTRPLGSGIMATALKREVLDEHHYPVLLSSLTTLNKAGEKLAAIDGVHAMTDITGFGLLGHLLEMLGDVAAEIEYATIPKLEGLDQYLQQKTIPDATFRNWNAYSNEVKFEKAVNVMEAFNLLPDPQTNGGLLVAVAPGAATEIEYLLKREGLYAKPIGRIVERQEKLVRVI